MAVDTSRQIKQMVNFIMQEAHEKVNEIRIKVTRCFAFCGSTEIVEYVDGARFQS